MPDDFAYAVAKALDEQQDLFQWSNNTFSYNRYSVARHSAFRCIRAPNAITGRGATSRIGACLHLAPIGTGTAHPPQMTEL